jgi:serine/threonine protein kinase
MDTHSSSIRESLLTGEMGKPAIAAILSSSDDSDNQPEHGVPERLSYVDVYRHNAYCIVKTPIELTSEHSHYLAIYNRYERGWDFFIGNVDRENRGECRSDYDLIPFQLEPYDGQRFSDFNNNTSDKIGPQFTDYQFFREVPFLQAMHRDAVCPLLNNIKFSRVQAGEQFISQGEKRNTCYIVQKGNCQVIIEKERERHVISRIGPKEFVGEMALLTGEDRSAHVVAESDMHLWAIDAELFDNLLSDFPEVSTFLTEIMAERFSTRKLTADRVIGKYLITDIIGRGGYSIVYKGYHRDLNRAVAVKMLNHDMALNMEFSRNFHQEAKTIANLNNEHIIKVYDIEKRFKTIFIIMELLEGTSLRERITETGKIQEKEVVEILIKICKGLNYAHQEGLVHQDIKPGNIFLLPDGGVKILDFGLACPYGSENLLLGTPFYMSPEQVECEPVDGRSDIYSLGLTAYEMLIGERPFQEEDPFKNMNMHVEQSIPDPLQKVPQINSHLHEFIINACERDPEKRYQCIEEVMENLENASEELGIESTNKSETKRRMSSLLLFYSDDQQLKLNRLLEEFSDKIKKEGIVLKATDFINLENVSE